MTEEGWAVILTYVDEGHVDDSDAAEIDYDEMLKDMKEGTEGRERGAQARRAIRAVHLVGWAEKPHYDAATKKLYWAQELNFEGSPTHTLNYDVRVLGREGVLSMNAVASMNQLSQISDRHAAAHRRRRIQRGLPLRGIQREDRSGRGIRTAALIAGTVAAKLGLFAKIGAFLLAFKKFIIIGVIAARRFSREVHWQEEGRGCLTGRGSRYVSNPAGTNSSSPGGENVLTAALAAGLPLPHSCRAGRCASCKAKIVSGEVAYPGDRLPPGIVAAEVARGEVLLCQAQPRCDLHIQTRLSAGAQREASGVIVDAARPLTTGGMRVTLRLLGAAPISARPGQFVDVETAAGERERVAVVAVDAPALDVEVHELAPDQIVRVRRALRLAAVEGGVREPRSGNDP